MVQEEGQDFAVHHIMAFYDIVLDFEGSQKSLPHEVLDGSNDSANAIWLPLEQITEENASPLVLKVKAELRGFPELDKTSYMNWKVKTCKNQLALSGEKIVEKVYPHLLHHVGLIRGEYLLRELNQNILLPNCQQFVNDYLDTICI